MYRELSSSPIIALLSVKPKGHNVPWETASVHNKRDAKPRKELKSKLFHISGIIIPFIATAIGFWLTIIAACIYIVVLAVIRYQIINGKRLPLGKLHDHLVATGNPMRKKAEGKHPLLSSYLLSVLVIFILTWQWRQMPIFFITVSILAVHDGLSAVIGCMS